MTLSTLDFLGPAPWLGQRADHFEYEVLDQDLNVYESIHPTVEAGPTITANTERAIMRTLDGIELIAGDLARITNPLGDRIRPVMVMPDATRYPLGVYLLGQRQSQLLDPVLGHPMEHQLSSMSLMDQGWILDQPVERSITLAPGDSIEALFVDLCLEVGISQVVLDPGATTVAAPVGWPAGTSRWRILDDLATKLGCLRPGFNNWGAFVCTKAPDAASPRQFLYGPSNVFADSILEADDSYRAPNRYIVIGTGATAVVGVWDLPDSAPHSAARRGFVVAQTVDVPGVETVEVATEAARSAGVQDSRSYVRVSFSSPLDPRHDLYAIIDWQNAAWLEVEQRLVLDPGGEHEHVLARLW